MLKNIALFKLTSDREMTASLLSDELGRFAFHECPATTQKTSGFSAPRSANGGLAEVVDGNYILRFTTEERPVPSDVIKRRVDEMAKRIENEYGRPPGRKVRKELKDNALLELLPKAFPRRSSVDIWINLEAKILAVGSTSTKKTDEIISALIKSVDGLTAQLIQTNVSPSVAMTKWLMDGEWPAGFSIDRDCELQATDESKCVIKYKRYSLDAPDVRQHTIAGRVPIKLGMTHSDRVSFNLTSGLGLKSIKLLDTSTDGSGHDDAFDANWAIYCGSVLPLIEGLIEALDGELQS